MHIFSQLMSYLAGASTVLYSADEGNMAVWWRLVVHAFFGVNQFCSTERGGLLCQTPPGQFDSLKMLIWSLGLKEKQNKIHLLGKFLRR